MRAVVKVSLTKQASDTLNNLRDSKFDKWYISSKKKGIVQYRMEINQS